MTTLSSDLIPIVESIRTISKSFPQSIALSSNKDNLTYADLMRRADEFAAYLMHNNVGSGDTVAICLERSFDWVIAALGIMQAGAAYVPLDISWPLSRLNFAISDSSAKVLVARDAFIHKLQPVCLATDPARDASMIAAAPLSSLPTVPPESLAYLIYTSGSTGTPKGVEVTHANLAHLVRWHHQAFKVGSHDRASHLAGLGFDAAGWEIWPNLSAAASICLISDEIRRSPELVHHWLLREHITISFVPTVHATPLMKMRWPASTALRLLLTGGEALRHGPMERLPFQVVNNYGPTEATVVATSCVLQPESHTVPPIGKPIAGAIIYLLDEAGLPVHDDCVGEIYVGGDGVARGYRNLPDATSRNFLFDPFSNADGARMYRTGDQGVRRADGNIEFRGRIDRQTKIRGQRVELDEISAVLAGHPLVEFATVTATSVGEGETQLVAYTLLKTNQGAPLMEDLQKHVADRLPEYMVPALYVRLDEIPLSTSGKLEIATLPKPTASNVLRRRQGRVATTPVEASLLNEIREMLGNTAIQIEDNYLLAGGHSLLSMQLIIRLRKLFVVSLSPRQLYEAPTIERLASVIQIQLHEKLISPIWMELLQKPEIATGENFFALGGTIELTHQLQQSLSDQFGLSIPIEELVESSTIRQQAELTSTFLKDSWEMPRGVITLQPNGKNNPVFWIQNLSIGLAKAMGEHQPFLYVGYMEEDFRGADEVPSLESIAQCLIRKILAVQPFGPYTLGGFSLGGNVALEIATQLRKLDHEVSLLVLVDPPSASYLGGRNPLTPSLRDPEYLLKRIKRLGLRRSLNRYRSHVAGRISRYIRVKSGRTDSTAAHELIERAATNHRAEQYLGKTLLVLATDHPQHVDFLPEWKGVLAGDLELRHLNGHHLDLLVQPAVKALAHAILSELHPDSEGIPSHLETDLSRTTAPRSDGGTSEFSAALPAE